MAPSWSCGGSLVEIGPIASEQLQNCINNHRAECEVNQINELFTLSGETGISR